MDRAIWHRLLGWYRTRGGSLLPAHRHSAAQMLAPGDQLGPYQIVRSLGSGGMGRVYAAKHTGIGRLVALKVLHSYLSHDEEMVARLLQEAHAANLVGHPGVVQITDHHRLKDGTTYLVMELLDGETLRARLRREPSLTAADILSIGGQLGAALAAAHARGVIHRDLKPENVMLAPNAQRVKILDFGIARAARFVNQLTGDGRRMGTPAYMAPEQCAGERAMASADVYALGALLYELCANRPPFVAEDDGALYGMHRYEEPRPLPELAPQTSESLSQLIHYMLAKAPSHRPTMAEVVKELMALGAPVDDTVPPAAASSPSHVRTPAKTTTPSAEWSFSGRAVRTISRNLKEKRWILPATAAAGILGITFWFGAKGNTLAHHIHYWTISWALQETERARRQSANPLGRLLDSEYYCTWFQNFQGGKVLYTVGGISGLPSGRHGRTFFIVSLDTTAQGNRWTMLQNTHYQSIREPSQFLRVAMEGRAAAPDIGLPKPFAPLADIGSYFHAIPALSPPWGVAGGISRLYAMKALDTVLGTPLIEECPTTMVIHTYEKALVLGGAPNGSCFETQGVYILNLDFAQPNEARGSWDRDDRQPLWGDTLRRSCLPPETDVSFGRNKRGR